MMDLEMADYERTVAALTARAAQRDSDVEEAHAEVKRLKETITTLQAQIGEYISLVSSP